MIFGIISIALCAIIIAVFLERVKELRSGETNDLDKY